MPDIHNHSDLFDSYLRRELSGSEREAFEQRLGSDMDFKASFELHSLLSEGIKEAGRTELKQYLKQNTPPAGGAQIQPIRRLFYAAAAIAVLGVGLYLVNAKFSAGNLKEEHQNTIVLNEDKQPEPSAPELKKEAAKDSTPVALAAPEAMADEPPPLYDFGDSASPGMAATDMPSPWYEQNAVKDAEESKGDYDVPQTMKMNSSDDVVLSDKKTFDTTVFATLVTNNTVFTNSYGNVRYKTQEKMILPQYNNNNINNIYTDTVATDRKAKVSVKKSKGKKEDNKEAEQEELVPEYTIEFWKSPLNYKGYSFDNKVIRLFGLTAKQVKLLQYDNKFYLKADDQYYLMTPTATYLPYKPIIEEPVLKQLSTY